MRSVDFCPNEPKRQLQVLELAVEDVTLRPSRTGQIPIPPLCAVLGELGSVRKDWVHVL